MRTETRTLTFEEIAKATGCVPDASGKLNLPATQAMADELGRAAYLLLYPAGAWQPGDPVYDVTITGPGPVWGYLCIAHRLHGCVRRLQYAAPNAMITVWSHGADFDDPSPGGRRGVK